MPEDQHRNVYEDGIDNPRALDRADVADVNGNANTTEILRFHYHQNALGSVSEMTQAERAGRLSAAEVKALRRLECATTIALVHRRQRHLCIQRSE